MAFRKTHNSVEHDQPVETEVEGEIREFVRRDVVTNRERQPENESELVASSINSVAVAGELDGRSGQFYNGLRPSKANLQAYDDTARERLRVLSLQLTGLA
jgi:hypothetical protein